MDYYMNKVTRVTKVPYETHLCEIPCASIGLIAAE